MELKKFLSFFVIFTFLSGINSFSMDREKKKINFEKIIGKKTEIFLKDLQIPKKLQAKYSDFSFNNASMVNHLPVVEARSALADLVLSKYITEHLQTARSRKRYKRQLGKYLSKKGYDITKIIFLAKDNIGLKELDERLLGPMFFSRFSLPIEEFYTDLSLDQKDIKNNEFLEKEVLKNIYLKYDKKKRRDILANNVINLHVYKKDIKTKTDYYYKLKKSLPTVDYDIKSITFLLINPAQKRLQEIENLKKHITGKYQTEVNNKIKALNQYLIELKKSLKQEKSEQLNQMMEKIEKYELKEKLENLEKEKDFLKAYDTEESRKKRLAEIEKIKEDIKKIKDREKRKRKMQKIENEQAILKKISQKDYIKGRLVKIDKEKKEAQESLEQIGDRKLKKYDKEKINNKIKETEQKISNLKDQVSPETIKERVSQLDKEKEYLKKLLK